MTLGAIHIYPIKSLDPATVRASAITAGGSLAFDRQWAMREPSGMFINGKKEPLVHTIRARYALPSRYVTLGVAGEATEHTYVLGEEDRDVERWLERALGRPVTLTADAAHGFPDDTDASGPTVVSAATLETVASWFPGLPAEEVRRRFRPNLVIDGVPPFWEDRLYTADGGVGFRIGAVAFTGRHPCARCVVPTRDSMTGAVTDSFMKTFIERRRATLPVWAAAGRFDHYYRLTVNTSIDPSEAGKTIRTGDPVVLL